MRNVLIGAEDAHDSETPTAQCTDEAAEEHSGKRFAKARIDASGRAIPSRLADGSAVNMYERQLNHGRKRRMRPAGKATLAPAAPRQTPIDPMSDLKSALKERGFKDAIDAYAFFDVRVVRKLFPCWPRLVRPLHVCLLIISGQLIGVVVLCRLTKREA
jgi:hypothetical protein